MSKTVILYEAKVVKFETSIPFSTVISRLDVEVNKAGSGDIFSKIRAVKSQEELESLIHGVLQNGFLYFMEMPFKILKFDDAKEKIPDMVVYTIGNPLLGQFILKYNTMASYHIPPRMIIIDKPDGSGSIVAYHLPSTVMSMLEGENNPALQAELETLDVRIEKLVERITAM